MMGKICRSLALPIRQCASLRLVRLFVAIACASIVGVANAGIVDLSATGASIISPIPLGPPPTINISVVVPVGAKDFNGLSYGSAFLDSTTSGGASTLTFTTNGLQDFFYDTNNTPAPPYGGPFASTDLLVLDVHNSDPTNSIAAIGFQFSGAGIDGGYVYGQQDAVTPGSFSTALPAIGYDQSDPNSGIATGFSYQFEGGLAPGADFSFLIPVYVGQPGAPVTFTATQVPEPSTLALLGLGAVGLFIAARRRVQPQDRRSAVSSSYAGAIDAPRIRD